MLTDENGAAGCAWQQDYAVSQTGRGQYSIQPQGWDRQPGGKGPVETGVGRRGLSGESSFSASSLLRAAGMSHLTAHNSFHATPEISSWA